MAVFNHDRAISFGIRASEGFGDCVARVTRTMVTYIAASKIRQRQDRMEPDYLTPLPQAPDCLREGDEEPWEAEIQLTVCG